MTQILLRNGANINAEDVDDVTPLHMSAYGGNFFKVFENQFDFNGVKLFFNMEEKHFSPITLCHTDSNDLYTIITDNLSVQ